MVTVNEDRIRSPRRKLNIAVQFISEIVQQEEVSNDNVIVLLFANTRTLYVLFRGQLRAETETAICETFRTAFRIVKKHYKDNGIKIAFNATPAT